MSDGLSDMHRGGGSLRDGALQRIGTELREYPEARWGRFIELGGMVRVYGWLDRDDGRADFILLDFDAITGELCVWITSAHPHPASVVERLENETSVECKRVENHFEIPNAVRLGESEPPAGEVERLRDGTKVIIPIEASLPSRPCPDCTAPTQVEGDAETTGQLRVGDWHHFPTKDEADHRADRWRELGWEVAVTETNDPVPHRVEVIGERCKRCDGGGRLLAGYPSETDCPDCEGTGKRQPEGGDEEEWPPSLYAIRTENGQVYAARRVASDEEFCRYVPATSQDSSGLKKYRSVEEIKRDLFPNLNEAAEAGDAAAAIELAAAEAQDRANKAEAERDQARRVIARIGGINPDEETEPFGAHEGAGPITWNEAGRRLEDMAERSASNLQRAETALGDLAEEFERRSKTPIEEPESKAGKYLRVANRANAEAASLARQKAAELKEER